MGAVSSKSGLVATRYAAALLDMAEDGKAVEAVEKDIISLQGMIAESEDFQKMMQNPLITREQQSKAVLAIADKAGFQELTKNFLGVVVANNRLDILSVIAQAFQRELTKYRGDVEAKVQTAFALSPKQTKDLQKKLSEALGSNVTLDVEVDNDLLGGMVVTVGSRMIDNSVKRKLEMLRRAMNTNEQQQEKVG